ncbi:MAG: ABC transporter permease [Dehalococcoidia bacterium]|nr:ABC transporter permease [Dehalococcoidia bacterium]
MRRMRTFLLWLTGRRLRASWRLLLVSFVAVLLGTTVIAATSLYNDTLAERGLQHALRTAPQDTLNAQLVISDRPLGEKEYRSLQTAVEGSVSKRLGGLLLEQHRFGRTETVTMVEPARSRPGLQGFVFFQTAFQEHSTLVRGRWPQLSQPTAEPGRLEVVVGQELARRVQWDVGFEVDVRPPDSPASDALLLTIVGIAVPTDPKEEYWLGDVRLFRLIETMQGPFIPMFIPERDFFASIAARYPTMPGSFWWRLYLDSDSVSTSSIGGVTSGLSSLEHDVNNLYPRSLLLTSLDRQLDVYQERLNLAQVPIFLFAALVVSVLLYYLWVVSGMLARSRGHEVILLRSRGASLLQTVLLFGIGEAMLVVLPAVALGPPLAFLLVRYPFGASLFGGAVSTLPSITLTSYGLSTLVGLLALAVLSSASLLAGLGSVASSLRERSRPATTLALHRYHIDLLLLAMVGLAWWQLRGRGGFITSQLVGEGVDVSPLTLVGPALGLFAAALVMLRAFPMVTRLLAKAAERLAAPWLLHGLRRVARDASLYSALCLLLTLSIALGIFGAMFSATLQDARSSQSLYKVGGEVVASTSFPLPSAQLAASIAALSDIPEVRAVSPVVRTTGSLVKGGPTMTMEVLSVDPETFAETAWFRSDFATKSLKGLMDPLKAPVPPNVGIPLPSDAQEVGVWTRPSRRFDGLNLWVHLVGANGAARDLFLGELAIPDWRFFSASFPEDGVAVRPFSVLSFFLTTGSLGKSGTGQLLLDDLSAIGPGGTTVVDAFDRAGPWVTFPTPYLAEDTVRQVGPSQARDGGALAFDWPAAISQDLRGVILPVVPTPLPVVAGPPFNIGDELLVSINRVLIPVRVAETAKFFPPLDPRRGSFLVLSTEHYLRYADAMPYGVVEYPNQLWLGLEPGAPAESTIAAIREALPPSMALTDSRAEADAAKQDPLTAGGWRSLVLLSLLALAGTAILGLLLFAALLVQTGRVELAVLETLGFSRMNVFALVAFEFAVVGVIGILAGVGIGLWIGRWALGYLSAQGLTEASLPPVSLSIDGTLSGLAIAGAVVAAGLAAAVALLATWRMRASSVLRSAE